MFSRDCIPILDFLASIFRAGDFNMIIQWPYVALTTRYTSFAFEWMPLDQCFRVISGVTT